VGGLVGVNAGEHPPEAVLHQVDGDGLVVPVALVVQRREAQHSGQHDDSRQGGETGINARHSGALGW